MFQSQKPKSINVCWEIFMLMWFAVCVMWDAVYTCRLRHNYTKTASPTCWKRKTSIVIMYGWTSDNNRSILTFYLMMSKQQQICCNKTKDPKCTSTMTFYFLLSYLAWIYNVNHPQDPVYLYRLYMNSHPDQASTGSLSTDCTQYLCRKPPLTSLPTCNGW